MLDRVAAALRYRRSIRKMAVPRAADPAYHSRFGGLWTDRRDAMEEIVRRQ